MSHTGEPASSALGSAVELSVIIPSYNRAERLQACLLGLAQQTLPAAHYEVIVVVDGATDATRGMLAGLALPYTPHVIWQTNQGVCAARNHGVAAARGRFCLFLDDDILPGPHLLEAHLEAHRRRLGRVGLGPITLKMPPHADGFARAVGELWAGHYSRLNQGQRQPTWRDCYSGNLSVERAALLQAGLFALELSASFDIELGYRLHLAGLEFEYLPEAAADHDDYKDFSRLAREAEAAGRGCVEVWQRHPATLTALLGAFGDTTPRQRLLRRLLLHLGAGPRWLAWLSRFMAGRAFEREWYQFLHTYFFWRGVKNAVTDHTTWVRLTYGTPILMYHAFCVPPETASRYVISRRGFALQLAVLKRLGYRVISLDSYVAARRTQQLPPAHAVVITIDDGYADISTQALPALERVDAPATVFVVSAHVGQSNQWDLAGPLHSRPLLTWPELRALQQAGHSSGGHSQTHAHLPAQSPGRTQVEIAGSRSDLERELGEPVRTFAYPFGERDAPTRTAVEQAGYWAACGVQRGLNALTTPLYDLRRIEVRGTDSLARVCLSVWLGDDALPRRRSAQPNNGESAA